MTRSDVAIKVIVPVVVALLSAGVAIYLARDRAPAKLVLERISLVPRQERIDRYGEWQITTLPEGDYERLRATRPHPEKIDEHGSLDNCFEADKEWNKIIPEYHLCGPAFLLNTDSEEVEVILVEKGILKSNTLGSVVHYIAWAWREELPGEEGDFSLSADDIEWWLPLTPSGSDKLLAERFALTNKLMESGIAPRSPRLRITLRNTGDRDATIFELLSTRIFWWGGDAGAGGTELSAVNSDFEFLVSFEQNTRKDLPSPIVLEPSDTTLIEFDLFVRDAAQGDGPGEILFYLDLSYFDGEENRELLLGNFLMSDDVSAFFTP